MFFWSGEISIFHLFISSIYMESEIYAQTGQKTFIAGNIFVSIYAKFCLLVIVSATRKSIISRLLSLFLKINVTCQ